MRQTLGAIGTAFLLVAGLVFGNGALGDPSRPGCGFSSPGSCDVKNLYRAVESVPVTDDYEARALMLLALGQVRTVDRTAFESLDRVYQGANTETSPCIRAVLLETIDENSSFFTPVGAAGQSWDHAVAAASSSDFTEARSSYLSVAKSKIGGSADVLLGDSYAARVNNLKKCSTIRKAPTLAAPAPAPRILAAPKPVQDPSPHAPANSMASGRAVAPSGFPSAAAPSAPASVTPERLPQAPSAPKTAPAQAQPKRTSPAAPEQATVHQMPNAPPADSHKPRFAAPPTVGFHSKAPARQPKFTAHPKNPGPQFQAKAKKPAQQKQHPKFIVHPKNTGPQLQAKAKKPKPVKIAAPKPKKAQALPKAPWKKPSPASVKPKNSNSSPRSNGLSNSSKQPPGQSKGNQKPAANKPQKAKASTQKKTKSNKNAKATDKKLKKTVKGPGKKNR